jgi:hypothetical protein
MKEPIDYGNEWKRLRYDWKKGLSRAQGISRGAKLLGSVLCEAYANSETGCCWPSNETLADYLDVHVRTIQRHVNELKAGGWIRAVHMPGRRRPVQLVFPQRLEHDNEHDRNERRSMTSVSSKHDTHVAPYREPGKNLGGIGPDKGHGKPLTCIAVGANEARPLKAWRQWLAANVNEDPEAVLGAVANDGHFLLPCRFPVEAASDREMYIRYFGMRTKVTRKIGARVE